VRHVVGQAADLAPGGRLIVVVEGRSIGVFNVGGELFALRDTCPHQGGPLCQGTLSGLLTASTPGRYRYERPGEVLRCPWHGWEFDIRTGCSLVDPERWRVRTYPVSVAGDQVFLEV
jgi:3-phenylpropionate/trans-cinnamate dioxygenase ferredoxin subunit